MSKHKSAGMRANWMYCCHSNATANWNGSIINLAYILHCTNRDSMKIDKIDSWLIKWFSKWCNVLILQNKIITLQIVSSRAPIVTISVSVKCLWCFSLSSYTKRNIVYFYLYYDNRILFVMSCFFAIPVFCFMSSSKYSYN